LVTSQTLLASAGTDLLLLFCRPLILLRKLQREAKPRVQIQTTKTKPNWSNHGINVAFKLMFQIQPIKNQWLKVNQQKQFTVNAING
jgi:hypothetical protein